MTEDDLKDESMAPELFFGLVGAVGTDLSMISEFLREALCLVRYECEEIKLSSLLEVSTRDCSDKYAEYLAKMQAGTELRKLYRRGDALVLEGLAELWCRRRVLANAFGQEGTDPDEVLPSPEPIDHQAYVFNSLKHPSEVDTLRQIYGKSFFLIAAYSAREKRLQFLSTRIADSRSLMNSDTCRHEAEFLLEKDRADHGDSLGQNVQKAFPLADVFVNCDDRPGARAALIRFIKLVFHNIEPYPKSLTPDLYLDSVRVDQAVLDNECVNFVPFVGIAPRQYLNLFDAAGVDRKKSDGTVRNWDPAEARPRASEDPDSYIERETKLAEFTFQFRENLADTAQRG